MIEYTRSNESQVQIIERVLPFCVCGNAPLLCFCRVLLTPPSTESLPELVYQHNCGLVRRQFPCTLAIGEENVQKARSSTITGSVIEPGENEVLGVDSSDWGFLPRDRLERFLSPWSERNHPR